MPGGTPMTREHVDDRSGRSRVCESYMHTKGMKLKKGSATWRRRTSCIFGYLVVSNMLKSYRSLHMKDSGLLQGDHGWVIVTQHQQKLRQQGCLGHNSILNIQPFTQHSVDSTIFLYFDWLLQPLSPQLSTRSPKCHKIVEHGRTKLQELVDGCELEQINQT